MMGLRMPGMPYLMTYKDVSQYYDKCKERTNSPIGERKLKDHATAFTGIRKRGDNYLLRYHSTDVVVWTPDKVLVTPYCSRSTGTFAERFLPRSISVRATDDHFFIRDRDDKVWAAHVGPFQMSHDGSILTPGRMAGFAKRSLNRKKTRELLARTRYADFREWLTITGEVLGFRGGPSWQYPEWEQTLDYLGKGEDGWYEIAQAFGTYDEKRQGNVLNFVRAAVYDGALEDGVITEDELYNTERTKTMDSLHFTGWSVEY